MKAERGSERMWWPWKVFFGVFVVAGVLVAAAGLLFLAEGEGPFAGVAVGLAAVAELVLAAVAGVNVVLYRAGRTQPGVRRAHGWLILAVPVVLLAWSGARWAFAPEPITPIGRSEFSTLLDSCEVAEVQRAHADHYDVILKDGIRLEAVTDISDLWAARDC